LRLSKLDPIDAACKRSGAVDEVFGVLCGCGGAVEAELREQVALDVAQGKRAGPTGFGGADDEADRFRAVGVGPAVDAAVDTGMRLM